MIRVSPAPEPPSFDRDVRQPGRRALAYEWSNYRFVTSLMNACKHAFEDVLDPFENLDDWFELELSTLQVRPSPSCDDAVRERVAATIERLRLNDEECIAARAHCYDAYLAKDVSFEHLAASSPFVAREMIRQGLAPPSGGLR